MSLFSTLFLSNSRSYGGRERRFCLKILLSKVQKYRKIPFKIKFFTFFRRLYNMNYMTSEGLAPCIAQTHCGDRMQADWSSFLALFAYPIPSKMQKNT